MTDETTFGGSLSEGEAKFFETGGESGIPVEDTGADAGGADGSTTTEAPAADAGADAPDQGKPGELKHVPLAALHEERTKRKALADTVKSLENQVAEFRGKFSIIDKLKGGDDAGAVTAPAGPPKPEDDIFGAVNAIQQRLDQDATAKKEAEQQSVFVNNYRADAAKFAQATPDYMAAYTHLLNSRVSDLQVLGFEGAALEQAIQADEIAIAEMAFSKGKSPAELLYNLAKQRGYAPAAAGKGPEASKGADKLDAIERGQAANKSLSATGGASGDADMTAERLISMPQDEFATWCEKNPAKARRLMGG